ncbi:MAG: peptide chain release factor N(5)-glutamine methyltransferase [Algibacter sp.]
MKLKVIQKTFQETLNKLYPSEEIDSFFYILMESYYKISRIQLAMDYGLSVANFDAILKALELLKQQKPIQYILGETEFYGLPFRVNQNTLIPRPETEELVEWVIEESKNRNSEFRILDIGTGSGCIAISLAKNLPNAKVYTLDVSKEALKVAKENAKLNTVDVEFIECDILNVEAGKFNEEQNFDIIVSNPPYVRNLEKKLMQSNVLDNEPHLALFVENENPLQFYKAITDFAVKNLNKDGSLFFEINEYLGKEMIQLLSESHFENIELKQDIFKRDRMVRGVKNFD